MTLKMAQGTPVDLSTWPQAVQFQFFRSFERPHYAVTTRIDMTDAIAAKAAGRSVYRDTIYAIGAGLHAVPELCMRFVGEQVTRYDIITLSMTVPIENGGFSYAYVPWCADRDAFDLRCADLIAQAATGGLNPNTGARDDLAYLSCLPWLDYTSINNALPHARDCIPRVGWGKIVPKGADWDMAMTIEVHHALVHGAQVGAFFAAVQSALIAAHSS